MVASGKTIYEVLIDTHLPLLDFNPMILPHFTMSETCEAGIAHDGAGLHRTVEIVKRTQKHVKFLTFKVKSLKSSFTMFPLPLLSVPSPSLKMLPTEKREGGWKLKKEKQSLVSGQSPHFWANSQVMSQAMGRASKTNPWITCPSRESQSCSRHCHSVLMSHSPGHMAVVALPLPQRAPCFQDFANKL